MKSINVNLPFVFLLLLSLVSFNCSDESFSETHKDYIEQEAISIRSSSAGPIEISIENGRIVIDNEDEYNILLSHIEQLLRQRGSTEQNPITRNDVLNNWESEIDFTSYRSDFIRKNSTNPSTFDIDELPIPDEILSTILNPNRIFQVSPWIFKLEPSSEKVFVLNIDDENLLPLLVENNEFSNYPEIQEYSYDDDVFEILSNEGEVHGWFGCGENNAPGKIDPEGNSHCNLPDPYGDLEWELIVKYDRFGIKEHLFVRFKHKDSNIWNNSDGTWYDLDYHGNYKPRCRDLVEFDEPYSTKFCGAGFTHLPHFGRDDKHTIYNQSRKLSAYFLQATVKFQDYCGTAPSTIVPAPIFAHSSQVGFCFTNSLIMRGTRAVEISVD